MSGDGGDDRVAAALAEQAAAHAMLAETVAALKVRAAPRAVAGRAVEGVRAKVISSAGAGARLAADRPVTAAGIVFLLGAAFVGLRRLGGARSETEPRRRELTERPGAPGRRRTKRGA